MRSRRKLQALIALAVVLGSTQVATAAQAVEPGSVTAVFNNTPGNSTWSAHANASGWSKGLITVEYTLSEAPSSSGPWTRLLTDSNQCKNATSCSTATVSGSGSNGWYRITATALGPGGNAENEPSSRTVHVHGGTGARAADSTDAASPAAFRRYYKPI